MGVGEVVWYVRLQVLRVGKHPLSHIKFIHLAAINRRNSAVPLVTKIVRKAIWSVGQRHDLPRGCDAAGGAVCPWKRSNHVVKAVIFFNDENDVLDGVHAGYWGWSLTALHPAALCQRDGCKECEQQPNKLPPGRVQS